MSEWGNQLDYIQLDYCNHSDELYNTSYLNLIALEHRCVVISIFCMCSYDPVANAELCSAE